MPATFRTGCSVLFKTKLLQGSKRTISQRFSLNDVAQWPGPLDAVTLWIAQLSLGNLVLVFDFVGFVGLPPPFRLHRLLSQEKILPLLNLFISLYQKKKKNP